MTPAHIIADAILSLVIGSAVGIPIALHHQSATPAMPDFSWISLLRDASVPGTLVAIIVFHFFNEKSRKEERIANAEEREKERKERAEERKVAAELLAEERKQASQERQHGMDRVQEITDAFRTTIVDLTRK